jgi:hypothetical protein
MLLQFRITKGGVTIVNVPLISLKATKTASVSKTAKPTPSPKPTPSASKSKPTVLQVHSGNNQCRAALESLHTRVLPPQS